MKIKQLLFVGLLFTLMVAACGGGSGDQPTGVVEDLAKAMQELDLDKASELYCEEMKDTLGTDLESGFEELEALGINADELLEAFKIKMEDMKYEEKSQEGDEAVVHVTGTLGLEFDTDKLKEFFKKAAEASGQEVSDEEIEFVVGMFGAIGSQEVPIDGDVEVVKEDGKWVVCGDVDFLQGSDLFELPFP